MNRRLFLGTAAAGLARELAGMSAAQNSSPPAAIRKLKPMTDDVQPIAADERLARIEKARSLMRQNGMDAVFCEPGSSVFYFTGVRLRVSGLAGLILPVRGDLLWVAPKADEEKTHANSGMGEVRSWSEAGGEFAAVAQALKDRGASNTVGLEEQVKFSVFDGLRKSAPKLKFVSGTPVTGGCRSVKSPAELALMQHANNVTIAAYKAGIETLQEGMTQYELSGNIAAAYRALGYTGEAAVSFGKYTAFPHGSIQPQKLQPGDLVLFDDGCSVEGYQSDITRTMIFGKPTARQKQIWELERKAQNAALAAAKPGATCESVDAAARKVITDFGFGPDYKVPGLPHRTGHGIGLDIHEWPYLVRGNKLKLQPGMTFSDEPMIAIYGEFGVRLEDCMYITGDGARTFTRQAPAIDQPFA
ncbi:MAG: Xaa-Pro peptidase family protein [Bryobacteraceae bacterium]|jgi:Xaa-Pro dipeptidase